MIQEEPDEMIWVKSQKLSHRFEYDIDRVWNFIKNVKRTQEAFSDVRSEPEFTKGSESYEVGSEYSFVWRNYLRLNFIVLGIIDEKDFKQQHLKIEVDITNVRYDFIYNFYRLTSDNSTLMKWEWIFEGEKGIKLTPKHIDAVMADRKFMIERFDKYLKESAVDLIQTESDLIPCEFKYLWKIITNWSIFKKIVPDICDECSYNDDPLKVGTILTIKKDNYICMLRVTKSEMNKEKGEADYRLISIDSKPKQPQQEICFKITEINEINCLLIFKHVYHESIKADQLRMGSKMKKKILKKLRKVVLKIYKGIKESVKLEKEN